ncbi:MAG: hypothetical protein JJU11_14400 [Candidatus Sumerlaeia bacterium]|nr:hypothetical protein [Candidatus Sumerlaeia bacterium]
MRCRFLGISTTLSILSIAAGGLAVNPDADSLIGIHWYPNTESISVGQSTDVEEMSDGRPVWVTEITHVDTAAAPAWDQPGYYVSHCEKLMTGKGHSVIFRIQPYWDRHVPHPDDPYTLSDFSADARAAAETLRAYCHIWQVGNEVNLRQENRGWNPGESSYSTPWQPTPEEYAETYIAIRDAIHEVESPLGPQEVLMQPVSPGNTDPTYRYMDGNEFLHRMIDAIEDKSRIDGFAIHAYAEPGGTNHGVDGFMESVIEQLMVIDSFGLGDRPVYITEFNKHMPNETEARIGARFLVEAYEALHQWNIGSGGQLPGHPNHNIRAATWFVYPNGGLWQDYSLWRWKSDIPSTSPNENPWHAFRHAAQKDYPAGLHGGGPTFPADGIWWEDDFSTLNTTPGSPHWRVEPISAGSAISTDAGVSLRGNNSPAGGASLRSAGYVYSDFNGFVDFTIVDGRQTTTSPGEANFDVRIREGSLGYSFTIYTSESTTRPGQAWLRRTNNWGENIDNLHAEVPGGVNDGDQFRLNWSANGSNLTWALHRLEPDGPIPLLEWEVEDEGQVVGYIRLGTYNMHEARLDNLVIGGPAWTPAVGQGNANAWLSF